MKKNLTCAISVVLTLLLLQSCAEEQDFDQYNDLDITPTVESSILYLETPERIINEAVGITYYTQDFNFDAFSQEYISERILDGVVIYEVENTTSKPLEITVEFLDEGGNVLDTEQFLIDRAPTSILRREIAYGSTAGRSIEIIRNTSSIRLSGSNLGNQTSTSSITDPKLLFRSAAKFRLRLK